MMSTPPGNLVPTKTKSRNIIGAQEVVPLGPEQPGWCQFNVNPNARQDCRVEPWHGACF